VVKALYERFGADDDRNQAAFTGDREAIDRWLDHVVIRAESIEINLTGCTERKEEIGTDRTSNSECSVAPQTTITIPWSAATFVAVKGIHHSPSTLPTMSLETRDTLLRAIAKARSWIGDLVESGVKSFSEVAAREGKVERHIRLLTPLAFVSPRIIAAIMDGPAPPDLTMTGLAQPLAHSWAQQERRIWPRTD